MIVRATAAAACLRRSFLFRIFLRSTFDVFTRQAREQVSLAAELEAQATAEACLCAKKEEERRRKAKKSAVAAAAAAVCSKSAVVLP